MSSEPDPALVEREWSNMVDGLVEEPLRGQLLGWVTASVDAAVRGPVKTEGLVGALGQILDVPLLTSAVWPEVDRLIGMTLGRDAVRLLTWLVAIDVEMESRLAEVAGALAPEAVGLLRDILARYGDVLARAFYLWNYVATDDDWRSVNWETVQTVGVSRFTTRVNLRKFNGEEIVFTGRPDGIVLLIRVLGESLANVPGSAFLGREEMELLRQTIGSLTGKVLDGEPVEPVNGELSRPPEPGGGIPIAGER